MGDCSNSFGFLPRPPTGPEERPPAHMHFKDMESAAEAAAESAKKAIAAAQAAAYLANKGPNQVTQSPGFNYNLNFSSTDHGLVGAYPPVNSNGPFMSNDPPINSHYNMGYEAKIPRRMNESESFDRSHYLNNEERRPENGGDYRQEGGYRRHTFNGGPHVDIKFDESDCDEGIETQDTTTYTGSICPPPGRDPPPVPSSNFQKSPAPGVHPKLPDYDTLAARFEALKYRKS